MERELSEIQDPFVYLEELDTKASRVLNGRALRFE
jgi:hypothetical protein